MTNQLLYQFTGNMFPRTLGMPYRCNSFKEYYIANSVEDIEEFIKVNNETNCYISVYSYKEYTQTNRNKMSAIINVLIFDFDGEDLNTAYNDLKTLLKWAHRHDIKPRVYFTGNRGYHCYVDFEPVNLQHPQETLRKFMFELNKAAGFTTLDLSIVGDLERIIRIPNTKHKSTGLYCIGLNPTLLPFFTADDIKQLAKEKSNYIPVRHPLPEDSDIHKTLYEMDEIVGKEIEEMNQKVEEERLREKNSLFPGLPAGVPCLAYRSCIDNGVSSGARNYGAAGIVQKCKKDGLTFDKTFRILIEFGEKCTPVISESELKSVLNYHWKADYSICTFFSKFCSECTCCVNRTF